MKKLAVITCLFLSACGGTETRPEVSRANIEPASDVTYHEFKKHEWNADGDTLAAQKRFISLDRNNDGRLSDQELGRF